MWSGDSSEQFAPAGQWLNPMSYQNVSNEDVDWASLAQQWIQMKETFPTVDQMNVLAPPPPPPPEKKVDEKQEDNEGEKGEAPMDMELDSKEDEMSKGDVSAMNGGNWGAQWNQWQQWGWGGWNAGMQGAPSYNAMQGFGAEGMEGSVSYPAVDSSVTSGEMMGKHMPRNQGFHHQSSQFIRHPNRVWKRGDKTLREHNSFHRTREERSESPEQPVLDAAKRKTLPAWIREGLEKMEREKQKKLIQEQERLARSANMKQEPVFDPLNPSKSKFDSESEQSEADDPPHERDNEAGHTSRSQSPDKSSYQEPIAPPPQRRLSKAEILENVMGIVRKQLTQLLMRVTSEEIERCAREVYSVFPGLKAQQQSQQRLPTSRSLKGNLGLGIYDDSGSESSESEDEVDSAKPSQKFNSAYQSEEVLRDQLNQRKREFSRIEREIEVKIQAQEEQERRAGLQDEEGDEGSEEEERDTGDQVHRPQPDSTNKMGSPHTGPPTPSTAHEPRTRSPEVGEDSSSPAPPTRKLSREERRKNSLEDSSEKRRKERSYSSEGRGSVERKREVSREKERRKERSVSHESSRVKESTRNHVESSRHYSESRESSDGEERRRKKKKKRRDSSRNRRDSEESRRSNKYASTSKDKYRESSQEKYRESSQDKYASKSKNKYSESRKDKYRESSQETYRESSRDKYASKSKDKYSESKRHRESSRDKYSESRSKRRDSSRDSHRSKKRQRSSSGERYSEKSHRSDRSSKKVSEKKSKRSDDYESDYSTSRKRSRYSVSPVSEKKKKSRKRSSRSSSYSSSRKHRR